MNRQLRRAALKQNKLKPTGGTQPPAAATADLFAQALWHQHHNKFDDAARLFKRLLTIKPQHAEAWHNFGCVLRAQGKPDEAAAAFQQLLMLLPQLLDDFSRIANLLVTINPAIDGGMRRADAAWPRRPAADELLGPAGISAIAVDPLLSHVLQATSVRNTALERMLTSLRLSILQMASVETGAVGADDTLIGFSCALAKQCFINEYVFAQEPDESELALRLKASLVAAMASGSLIAPLRLTALAMYIPLYSLPGAQALLDQHWPPAAAELLLQQVREPAEERRLRDTIPQLTSIDDDVSLRVQQQYEDNPYPRWVNTGTAAYEPVTIDAHMRVLFPTAPFRPVDKSGDLEILIAGCGTGRHPIGVAQTYQNPRVLAVDLSLASLCYAKRKTPPQLVGRIDYGQADILKLGSLGQKFDLIDASGVLHHMADPFGAWRILLALLRPNGIMHIGLYSELARREVVEARAFIAERGYRPTANDIRHCRQDLLNSPLKGLAKLGDFFSTSECRDLLFHVQERRLTIPDIKSFIVEQGLTFIGFDLNSQALRRHRANFAETAWSTDLDRWHAFEMENPDTFAGMYQFWVQKA